MQLVNVIK